MYYVEYTRKAEKDIKEIKKNQKLLQSFIEIIKILESDPYQFVSGQHFEKIKQFGNDIYSRRLNIKDRVAYKLVDIEFEIKINEDTTKKYDGIVTILPALGHPY